MVLSFIMVLNPLPSIIWEASGSSISEGAPAHLLIKRILFSDIMDGEFFSILNPTATMTSLLNWSISDGEGRLVFQKGFAISSGEEIVIARNATRFREQNGCSPDFSILPGDGRIETLVAKGSFRLANDGDELVLTDASGRAVDGVAFGPAGNSAVLGDAWHGSPVPSPGKCRIIERQEKNGIVADTDSASDWLSLKDDRPGQSDFQELAVRARVRALILPEHSNVILDRIDQATSSLLICSYEFDSVQILDAINRSMHKGVAVKMLLEGTPAGGISNQSRAVIAQLESEGAHILLMQSAAGNDVPRRYSYVHAKYIVIDDRISIVLSENLVANVFDIELGHGNRGWAAIIDLLNSPQGSPQSSILIPIRDSLMWAHPIGSQPQYIKRR